MSADTAIFEAERPGLTALCYRMLGERAGAEDAVQDTWLRWQRTDRTRIENPRAWLRRTATRIAIDALRSARARRETYPGPWLPEPIVESPSLTVEDRFALAQECELALLWAMERLSETERAAPSEVADLLQRFMAAAAAQDHAAVLDLLSPVATAYTDGGRKARAALRPLRGPADIVQVLMGVMMKSVHDSEDWAMEPALANGAPALIRRLNGKVDLVLTLAPGPDGRIAWLYAMRNPDKLPG